MKRIYIIIITIAIFVVVSVIAYYFLIALPGIKKSIALQEVKIECADRGMKYEQESFAKAQESISENFYRVYNKGEYFYDKELKTCIYWNEYVLPFMNPPQEGGEMIDLLTSRRIIYYFMPQIGASEKEIDQKNQFQKVISEYQLRNSLF